MTIPDTSKQPRISMLRTYSLADIFTLINAACGTIAVFLCLNYAIEGEKRFLWIAFLLLPCALICDFLDGYVARRRNRQSSIGADLDSLSDIVSFGVAPAVLGFTLGLRGIWDMLILVYFILPSSPSYDAIWRLLQATFLENHYCASV